MASTEQQPDVSLSWDKSEPIAREAAEFAGRVIGSDNRYISHGEIQTGLSPDGKRWADQLSDLYAEDFMEMGDDRDLLTARNEDGELVGIAVLAWEESARRKFAVLEDMAVDPSLRSQGLGAVMLAEVKTRTVSKDVDWLFLESGLGNEAAHRFFERHGFHQISHVYGCAL